jgi:membrane dipeptidase
MDRAFHDEAVVVDAHHDLLLLVARDRLLGKTDSFRRRWIPELRAGGVDVQVLPIHMEAEVGLEGALRRTLLLLAYAHEEAVANPDDVSICETGAGIDDAIASGRIACILALEGSQAVGADVELFALLFRLGVRMASFSWFGRTLLADGTGEGDGGGRLSRAGVKALGEIERLGIVMDVSHLSDAGTDQVLELATRPVVASHSSARAVTDHARNLTDDHIRGIAATGGVIGINLFPLFVDPLEPTIDRVIDHVEHVASVGGIDHVGIGTDFVRELYDEKFPADQLLTIDGFDRRATIRGIEAAPDLPNLTAGLLGRGFGETEVRKILGENFLRVFRDVMGRARPS